MIIAKAPDDAIISTLLEKAYLAVLDVIQQQIISSGQQIVELRLAKELGISRTPIRQALRLLEGEGSLQKSVGRSYIVRRFDLREYLQSLKLRELLESEAAFSAA